MAVFPLFGGFAELPARARVGLGEAGGEIACLVAFEARSPRVGEAAIRCLVEAGGGEDGVATAKGVVEVDHQVGEEIDLEREAVVHGARDLGGGEAITIQWQSSIPLGDETAPGLGRRRGMTLTRASSIVWLSSMVLVLGCRAASTQEKPPAPIVPVTAEGQGTVAPEVPAKVGGDPGRVGRGTPLTPRAGHELGAFAAGCFWGVEDAFRKVPGVTATAVGYTGGHTKDPTYEAVCEHGTGHAETVLVEFDPKVVGYEKLLSVFFRIHDPTTLNRQGPDVGDQYRSAIFTFSPAQEAAAKAAMERAQGKVARPIVTQIKGAMPFYRAEDYHQQYSERTGHHGCAVPNVAQDI